LRAVSVVELEPSAVDDELELSGRMPRRREALAPESHGDRAVLGERHELQSVVPRDRRDLVAGRKPAGVDAVVELAGLAS
jgi:hypothetical protein